MEQELKNLTEQWKAEWPKLKEINDRADSERKAHGEALAETKENLAKVEKAMGEKEARLADLEKKLARPDMQTDAKPESVKARTNAAIRSFIGAPMTAEQKALVVGTNTAAGYLAMEPEWIREIVKDVVEVSPIRQFARVISSARPSIKIPVKTAGTTTSRVGERGTKSETTGLAFALREVPSHEYYANVYVSDWMLEDTDYDLAGEINMDVTEQLAKAEGAHFVSGTASEQPEGILTNTTVLANYVASGTASEVTADGLISLYFGVLGPYRNVGTWFMADATMAVVRKLKDGSGNYLLDKNLSEAAPWQILGRPVVSTVDMPAIGSNTYPVMFGDLSKAYVVFDHVGMAMIKDNITAWETGTVKFGFRKRTGGIVRQPEAVKILKCSAT